MSELGRPAGSELSYGEWLEQIKRQVSDAQRRAAHAVNAELIGVYWEIGREILVRQAAEGNRRGRGGPRIVQQLSADLAVAFPGTARAAHASTKYFASTLNSLKAARQLRRRAEPRHMP